MEAIPRISRAQSMDALSSQANVAGYKAALLGAEHATRFYPMLMTAAGTIPPAKVLVLGAGVAGLQALATARRLGAQTTGYDVRPEVAEQVQSLGAKWLDLGIEAAGEGGYARELTDEEQRPAAAGADRRDQGLRRRHHHGARARPPGAAAGHRRGGRGHEAGQRDRRPRRRGGRQLRADRARRGGRQARRDDRLAAEPAGDDARARIAALRAQRAGAARAARSTTRADARAWTSTTRSSPARASCATGEAGQGLMLLTEPGDPRAGRLRRLRGDLQGAQHAAHAADVGHQRDPRDRRARRHPRARPRRDGFLNKLLLVIAIAFGTINVVGGFLVTDRMLEMFKSKPAPATEEERGRAARSRRPSADRLHRAPLHRRLLPVHLRADGADGAAHGGARQPHRRRRHGDRGRRDAADPGDGQLGPDRPRRRDRHRRRRSPRRAR